MDTESNDQVGDLIRVVGDFSERLKANTARTEELRSAQRSQRRVIFWVGIAVVLIAVGISLFIIVKDNTATSKIRANADEIRAIQDRTSNEVLCPLYSLLLQAEPRAVNNPVLTKDQKDEVIKDYVVIHQGFTALRCKG